MVRVTISVPDLDAKERDLFFMKTLAWSMESEWDA